ncbi:MFS transporter [Streptomyces sp. NPDC008125]|uniref:MFS transporter n=1 Tax=Streptomyces sp. NPDC008125 TaxID=3364811 RepID=UPI0036E3B4D1
MPDPRTPGTEGCTGVYPDGERPCTHQARRSHTLRRRHRLPLVIAVGYGVRYFTSHSLWTIVAGATVVASGTAIAYSALPALVMRAVPVSETGAANGLNTLMRSVGQAFCSAAVAAVLSNVTFRAGGLTAPTLHAYQLVFVIAGAAALLALLVTLLLLGAGLAEAGTVAGTKKRADRKAGAPARTIQEGA